MTLRSQAQTIKPIINTNNIERTHVRQGQMRRLETVFGVVEVERTAHGGRSVSALHPVDAASNLPERSYSHELQRQVSMTAARMSYDTTNERLKTLTPAQVPKRQAAEIVQPAAKDFETFYDNTALRIKQATSSLLVLTSDQKGVVMRKDDLTKATRKLSESKTNKLDTRQEGTPEVEAWVLARLERILQGKVSHVVAGMTRMATARGFDQKKRGPINTSARYLLKRNNMMKGGELLEFGAPIASGIIEGACRHLINDRLDITGARWNLPGAEAVLRLRSLLSSGDFDTYWRFH